MARSALLIYADRHPAVFGPGSSKTPWALIRGEDPEDPRPWDFVQAPGRDKAKPVDVYVQEGATAEAISAALERLGYTSEGKRDPSADDKLAVLDGWARAVLKRAEGGR